MPAFGYNDEDVFARDMGVDVVFGSVTVKALLDETDIPGVSSDGQVEGIIRGTTLTMSARAKAQLVGMTIDSYITVDGRGFVVREFLRLDDARMWHILVAEATTTQPPVDSITIEEA